MPLYPTTNSGGPLYLQGLRAYSIIGPPLKLHKVTVGVSGARAYNYTGSEAYRAK
jgi:hypothetical protein